jgi:SAM-dependent methyltransferase
MTPSNKPGNTNTYDFYINTKRDKFFEAHEAEIERLRGDDGNIKSEFAEPVEACPVCGGQKNKTVFHKQGFAFKQCTESSQCDHVYADPQINEDALAEAYRGGGLDAEMTASDIWMEVLLSQANQDYDRMKYARGVKAIESALGPGAPASKKLLDVGCSVGVFLDVARSMGWDTIGLELNQKAVGHACQTLGLDVRCQTLEQAGFPENHFDAVTLWGVIEHLKQPVGVLKEIHRVLKPGGVLLTFCPNAASLVCRMLREQAATFDGHDHPSNFTPTSIKLAMELSGFNNLAISFHQPDMDALINYTEGRDPYYKGAEVESPLKDYFQGEKRELAEAFLLKFGLGYKMMTVNIKA